MSVRSGEYAGAVRGLSSDSETNISSTDDVQRSASRDPFGPDSVEISDEAQQQVEAEEKAAATEEEANPTEPSGETNASGESLTEEELELVEELEQTDQEVRAHEQAHLSAAGGLATSGASFTYETGPDGQQYAVAGEVGIDTSEVPDDPEATANKARQIRAAALAPADPSSQDLKVAADASQMEAEATAEMAQQQVAQQQTGESQQATDAQANSQQAASAQQGSASEQAASGIEQSRRYAAVEAFRAASAFSSSGNSATGTSAGQFVAFA